VHSTARNGANKRTHATGARATHADMETAAKAVYALVVAAQKIGWQHPAKTVGAPKPDAFTASNLPAPGKAATVAGGKK